MILQTKLEDRKYQLPTKGAEKATASLSIPGQAFNLKFAMEQYKKGTLIERVKGYYEQHGMVAPDFRMMDRIQKLEALAEFRRMKSEAGININQARERAIKKQQDGILEKQKAEATKAPTGGKADDSQPPNAK